MARKTVFQLEWASGANVPGATISIIGEAPDYKPYVSINTFNDPIFIKDRDLERFAVNILKALGSDRLINANFAKQHKQYKKRIKKQ